MTRRAAASATTWATLVRDYFALLGAVRRRAATSRDVRKWLQAARGFAAAADDARAVTLRHFTSSLSAVVPEAATRRALRAFASRLPATHRHGHFVISLDVFSDCIPAWTEDLARFRGRPGLHFLEIGSFEGLSTCWLLEHVLTHPTSRITCVDLFRWEGQNLGSARDLEPGMEDRFDYNVRQTGAAARVDKRVGASQDLLRGLPADAYDFVYVDGSHETRHVLEDAVLAWRLLKVGGLMTFDDYADFGPTRSPRTAVDAFLACYDPEVRVVRREYQVTVQKIAVEQLERPQ